MIINTELQPRTIGNCRVYDIVISYLNADGVIDYKKIALTPQDMYRWDHTRQCDIPDTRFESWDSRKVLRVPLKNDEKFPDSRVSEIVYEHCLASEEFNKINELVIPELAFVDIECMVGQEFPKAEEATHQVNTIAYVYKNKVYVLGLKPLTEEQCKSIQRRIDEHCKSFKTRYEFSYFYFTSEVSMLAYFFEYFVKPVVAITGWNFLRYDWQYLVNRCKNLGINIKDISPTGKWYKQPLLKLYNKKSKADKVWVPAHKIVFDYMEVYQKWDTTIYPHDSLKLDDVGEQAVGVKKVQHAIGFDEMWEEHTEDYVFYNAVDAILVREIHNKIATANIFFALANLVRCDLMLAFSPVRSLEVIQTRYIYDDNKVFTTDYDDDEIEKEAYEGAYVYDPNSGAFEDVMAFDFASLYPTTMRQFNISPDTFVCKDINRPKAPDEIKCSSGAVYERNKEGILPKILTFVYSERKRYKKEMMIAIDEMYHLEAILERRLKENK